MRLLLSTAGPQAGFGLRVYEQDFLWTQYEIVPELRTNATFADDWLEAMADAAEAHNLTIQYCMPYPRDYIASTRHRAVTTIRATDDYKPNNRNWRIARQSLLAHAVGILPFKDTFLSGSSAEVGAANPGPELSPELHALVSTLSGAMVGPGDGPHMANRTVLMRSCMLDGILLKPDRPAVPIDAAWGSNDPGGELVWSFSALTTDLGHERAQHYVLAAALERPFNLTLDDLDLPTNSSYVARDWFSGELRAFDEGSPLLLSMVGLHAADAPVPFSFWTISEIVNDWALLGELNKYVTASARRISTISTADGGASGDSLNVTIRGAASEEVTLCAIRCARSALACATAASPLCQTAIVGATQEAVLVF
jgi:hypothetical protein